MQANETRLLRFYFREWRKFRAYTQEEAAAKLKVKRQTLSRIENGKADFTIRFLVNFANLVQCQSFTDPIVRAPDTRDQGGGNAGN
jgi:DNA-binding XRE family transcriptional regulator